MRCLIPFAAMLAFAPQEQSEVVTVTLAAKTGLWGMKDGAAKETHFKVAADAVWLAGKDWDKAKPVSVDEFVKGSTVRVAFDAKTMVASKFLLISKPPPPRELRPEDFAEGQVGVFQKDGKPYKLRVVRIHEGGNLATVTWPDQPRILFLIENHGLTLTSGAAVELSGLWRVRMPVKIGGQTLWHLTPPK